MIISPNGLAQTNVLHVVNNAYKCTDQVFMFSQAEEDCNLCLRKLYWERDPEDTFEAPNFILPLSNLFLIRDDLAGADVECDIRSVTNLYVEIPYRIYNRNGYTTGEEANDIYTHPCQTILPLIRPYSSYRSLANDFDALTRMRLFCSYFPVQAQSLHKDALQTGATSPEDLKNMDFLTAKTLRIKFGEERRIQAVLFYRPWKGVIDTENADHAVQLLTLPDYSVTHEEIFNSGTAKDYQEPDESICQQRSFKSLSVASTYLGGIPCVANLDAPVAAKELFLRWSGYLTHFQLLDSPIIRPESWTLADNPEMTYQWPFLEEKVLAEDPILDGQSIETGRCNYEYKGDISTGIRFAHPLGKDTDSSNDPGSGYGNSDPYTTIDPYGSVCVSVYDDEGEGQGISDIWTLRNFDTNSYDPNYPYYDMNRYNPSLEVRTEQEQGDDGYTVSVNYATRDVGDNKFYVANKSLVQWYYSPATNSWKSNHTRPSTANQLRLLITMPEVQVVKGCLNPMAVPAIFNKPTFFCTYSNPSSPLDFRFRAGVYDDYLIPQHVLLEGRADNNLRTQWDLIDEFTLDHFSTRAHTYFSYPRKVKYIRITVQDWYGTRLMDDVRKDYFYISPTNLQGTYSYEPGQHYGAYNALYGDRILLHGEDYSVGKCLDNAESLPSSNIFVDNQRNYLTSFAGAKTEWQKWKDRTIQSLWKGIYIPPFLFFGENGG